MRRKALLISAALVIGVLGASGAAAKPHEKSDKKSKKATGEIVSFAASEAGSDSAGLLTYTATGEAAPTEVPVAADVQIKLRHRGEHAKSKGHGNPSHGDLDDLVAGATILRMKLDDGAVSKLRLKLPAAEGPDGEAPSDEATATPDSTDPDDVASDEKGDEEADEEADDKADEEDDEDAEDEEEDDEDQEEDELGIEDVLPDVDLPDDLED